MTAGGSTRYAGVTGRSGRLRSRGGQGSVGYAPLTHPTADRTRRRNERCTIPSNSAARSARRSSVGRTASQDWSARNRARGRSLPRISLGERTSACLDHGRCVRRGRAGARGIRRRGIVRCRRERGWRGRSRAPHRSVRHGFRVRGGHARSPYPEWSGRFRVHAGSHSSIGGHRFRINTISRASRSRLAPPAATAPLME